VFAFGPLDSSFLRPSHTPSDSPSPTLYPCSLRHTLHCVRSSSQLHGVQSDDRGLPLSACVRCSPSTPSTMTALGAGKVDDGGSHAVLEGDADVFISGSSPYDVSWVCMSFYVRPAARASNPLGSSTEPGSIGTRNRN
jgi:hypothetical protein